MGDSRRRNVCRFLFAILFTVVCQGEALAVSPDDLVGCWTGGLLDGTQGYLYIQQEQDGTLICHYGTPRAINCTISLLDNGEIALNWQEESKRIYGMGSYDNNEDLQGEADVYEDGNSSPSRRHFGFTKGTACPTPSSSRWSHPLKSAVMVAEATPDCVQPIAITNLERKADALASVLHSRSSIRFVLRENLNC